MLFDVRFGLINDALVLGKQNIVDVADEITRCSTLSTHADGPALSRMLHDSTAPSSQAAISDHPTYKLDLNMLQARVVWTICIFNHIVLEPTCRANMKVGARAMVTRFKILALKVQFGRNDENLEKEKCQLESIVKKLVHDLEEERGQTTLLSEQITNLEKLLNEKKQQQLESLSKTEILADMAKQHEKVMEELLRQLEEERCGSASMKKQLSILQQQLSDAQSSAKLQASNACTLEKELSNVTEEFTHQVALLKEKISKLTSEKGFVNEELKSTQEKMEQEIRQRQGLEDQILMLKQPGPDNCAQESKTSFGSGLGNVSDVSKSGKHSQRSIISKILEKVGLPNVLALLKSEDLDVQIHAVQMVARLAAEDTNQEKIVAEGGLDALLSLLETSENTTIHRVTAVAVANLAMNESSQGMIMNKGGARLLANVASKTNDPQTLRLVAGAIANLCGNEKLHLMLKQDGGIKALIGMFRTGHSDVIDQMARGIANFAKSESRVINQGHSKGKSLLIEDGVLSWMVANSNRFPTSTRRHIELAFCHLARNEVNTCDMIASGGIKELLLISRESRREDMRRLAKKALDSNPAFLREIQ